MSTHPVSFIFQGYLSMIRLGLGLNKGHNDIMQWLRKVNTTSKLKKDDERRWRLKASVSQCWLVIIHSNILAVFSLKFHSSKAVIIVMQWPENHKARIFIRSEGCRNLTSIESVPNMCLGVWCFSLSTRLFWATISQLPAAYVSFS